MYSYKVEGYSDDSKFYNYEYYICSRVRFTTDNDSVNAVKLTKDLIEEKHHDFDIGTYAKEADGDFLIVYGRKAYTTLRNPYNNGVIMRAERSCLFGSNAAADCYMVGKILEKDDNHCVAEIADMCSNSKFAIMEMIEMFLDKVATSGDPWLARTRAVTVRVKKSDRLFRFLNRMNRVDIPYTFKNLSDDELEINFIDKSWQDIHRVCDKLSIQRLMNTKNPMNQGPICCSLSAMVSTLANYIPIEDLEKRKESIKKWVFLRNTVMLWNYLGSGKEIDAKIYRRYAYTSELEEEAKLREQELREASKLGHFDRYYTLEAGVRGKAHHILFACDQKEKMVDNSFFGSTSSYRFALNRWVRRSTEYYGNVAAIDFKTDAGILRYESNTMSAGSFVAHNVPYITENVWKRAFSLAKFEHDFNESPCVKADSNKSFICDIMMKIARYISISTAQKLFDRITDKWNSLSGEEQDNRDLFVHDILINFESLFAYDKKNVKSFNLMLKLLTKGALDKLLLDYSFRQAGEVLVYIQTILPNSDIHNWNQYIAEIRPKLSRIVRTNTTSAPIKEFTHAIVHEREAKASGAVVKFYGKAYETLLEYVAAVKEYATNASVSYLERLFGKEALKKFVLGTYPGTFEPTSYASPALDIAGYVRRALGRRGEGAEVRNPNALFNHLRSCCNVRDVLAGKCDTVTAEKVVSALKHFGMKVPDDLHKETNFRGVIERKGNPEYIVAGNASVCCMSLGNTKAIEYALWEGFGIFNVYYGNRIIANSVIYINNRYNALVIDNIEVHENYKKYNLYIDRIYRDMITDVMKKYNLDYCLQGYTYNDLALYATKRGDAADDYGRVSTDKHSITQKNIVIRNNDKQPEYIDSAEVYVIVGDEEAFKLLVDTVSANVYANDLYVPGEISSVRKRTIRVDQTTGIANPDNEDTPYTNGTAFAF